MQSLPFAGSEQPRTRAECSSRSWNKVLDENLTQAPLQCERRPSLTHFHPLQRAMTVRHGVLLGHVSTQPLQIAPRDRLSKSFSTATMFYVVISVW